METAACALRAVFHLRPARFWIVILTLPAFAPRTLPCTFTCDARAVVAVVGAGRRLRGFAGVGVGVGVGDGLGPGVAGGAGVGVAVGVGVGVGVATGGVGVGVGVVTTVVSVGVWSRSST